MVGQDAASNFGALLRRHREEALLSQERLGERAGLSARTVRDLEAGRVRRPRADSVWRLADALSLDDAERAAFTAAARRAGPSARAPRPGTLRLISAMLDEDQQEAAPRPPVAPLPVPAQLPMDVYGFTGRGAEIEALDGMLAEAEQTSLPVIVSAVSGTAGVGKTALAVHWARQVSERFPDGQLFVDLRGYDPDRPLSPDRALGALLRHLGVSGPDVPPVLADRVALYRSLMAGRRMLVMLDNASSVDQVRPLLPGAGSSLIVVTSRDSLAGLVARDGARRLDLDLLPPVDAVQLMRVLVAKRVDAEPEAARELAEHCVRLPLALRIAAELAVARPTTPLRDLAAELRDEQRRLDLLDAGGDHRTALRAVFSWSYRHLTGDAARAFRLLGLHPGRAWDQHAVRALLDTELDHARQVLDLLVRAHLVQAGGPNRFGMHDLLHAYAAFLADRQDDESDRRAALTRLFDYYLATSGACVDALYPHERHRRPDLPSVSIGVPGPVDAARARTWLDVERANLVAIATHPAHLHWSAHAVPLSQVLWRYLFTGAHYGDAITVHRHAHRAAQRLGDRAGEGGALRHLGAMLWRLGRYEEALEHNRQALDIYQQIDDRREQGSTLNNLGVVYDRLGRPTESIAHYARAHALALETGDRTGEASTLNNLGIVYERMGRYPEAIGHYEQALAIRRAIADRTGEGLTLGNLGTAHTATGRLAEARACYRQALAIAREGGERNDEAFALNGLGVVLRRQGRHVEALGLHQQALAIARDTANRPVETSALNGLAEVAHAEGDPRLACVSHEAALSLAQAIGERYQEARAHEGIARALDAMGRRDDARRRLRDALGLYRDLRLPEADRIAHHLADREPPAAQRPDR